VIAQNAVSTPRPFADAGRTAKGPASARMWSKGGSKILQVRSRAGEAGEERAAGVGYRSKKKSTEMSGAGRSRKAREGHTRTVKPRGARREFNKPDTNRGDVVEP